MKYRWDKKYLYWGLTAFAVIAASIIFFIALFNIQNIWDFVAMLIGIITPVIIGFVIAYLLSPVEIFFEKKCFGKLLFWLDKKIQGKKLANEKEYIVENNTRKICKISRGLAVVFALIFALLLIVGIVSAILPQLVTTIQALINNMPEYLESANNWALKTLENYPDVQKYVTEGITSATTFLDNWLKNDLLPQISNIVAVLSTGIMGFFSVFMNIILGFIISIYFLFNKDLFTAQGKKLLYSIIRPRTANKILRNIRNVHKTFGGFITGKLVDCLIIGALFFILMTIFNMPYAILISVFMGVCNIVPYFGAFIGAIPSCLILMLENPILALYFIIMVIIIQQLDGNVISPKILGDSTGLSSFWVIFAIIVGQGLFGFIGLIIGIPLFAVIYSIVKGRVSKQLIKKGLPHETDEFKKVAYIEIASKEVITLEEVRAKEIECERKKNEKRMAEKLAKKKEKLERKNKYNKE